MLSTRKTLSILIVSLAILITSCGGGENKIVYRDRPATTVVAPTTNTTAASSMEYSDYTLLTTVRSDYFGFTAEFPSFGYSEDEVSSYDLKPTSTTTEGGKMYHNNILAATKGDKLIYCDTVSDACKLVATFGISVYPDNEVNRAQVAPDSSYMDCTERTFTGVSGQDCYWGDEGGYYRDVFIRHNGWIYNIGMHGPPIFGQDIFDSFVRNFGFNGT